MLIRLLRIELAKTRRSLALLMALACPFVVVLLNFMIQVKSKRAVNWEMYWMGQTAVWSYFMYPLYIALVTALLNGNEHRNGTWRVMLTMPISRTQLYLAKLLLAFIFLLASNLALFVFAAGSIYILGLLGFSVAGAFEFDFAHAIMVLMLASLPILSIQHWISWRIPNIVAPLTLSVAATMAILQVGQSKDWVYHPWTYVMAALNASELSTRQNALYLGLGIGLSLILFSLLWVKYRSQEFR